MLSRTRRGLLVLFAVGLLVFVVLRVNRPATVRGYYRLERAWSAHWPLKAGSDFIERLEPAMLRTGLLGPARIEVEPGISFLLDPRDMVPVNILRSGEWQPEIWRSLSPALSEGSVFLDVGAHIGYFSIKAARKVGAAGRVIAFEPNPETLQLLRDNVAADRAANVTVEPVACTEREETLTLYAAAVANSGASSLAQSNSEGWGSQPPRQYKVPGRPIDAVVRELDLKRVDAMKIDVEGAEVYVLRGAVETLKRFHPRVIVEVDARQLANMQTTPEDVAAVLRSAGYNRSKPLNVRETDWEWTVQDPRQMLAVVHMADKSAAGQLVKGFYGVEGEAWRWTAGRFAVALRPPSAAPDGATLTLKFAIPGVSIQKLKQMTLSAKVGGVVLPSQTFTAEGQYTYVRHIPPSAYGKDAVDAEFWLDRYLAPPDTGVDLGVLATSVALEPR